MFFRMVVPLFVIFLAYFLSLAGELEFPDGFIVAVNIAQLWVLVIIVDRLTCEDPTS